jgi:hypothetical protein
MRKRFEYDFDDKCGYCWGFCILSEKNWISSLKILIRELKKRMENCFNEA